MCIAILKQKEKTIDKDLLKTCSENNRDGCGFAYVDNGKIIIKKFMEFEKFWEEYSKVQDNHTMLIHFRIATHGKVELSNCHPFKLNNKMAIIHNGIISGYGSKTENLSDTKDFINKVIGNITYKIWKNPSFRELVGMGIGNSKLVILDNEERYYIINENKGEWVDGVWFSNSSYKKKPVVKQYTKNNYKSYSSYDDYYYDKYNMKPVNNNYYYTFKCPKCGKFYHTNNWVDSICSCGEEMDLLSYRNYYGEQVLVGRGV